MMKRLKQRIVNGVRKTAAAGLAAGLMLGTAFPASAMVWSGDRPLIRTMDVAGTGAYDDYDGPAELAQFRHPAGVLVLDDGSILVADAGNHRIRIVRDGTVSVYAGINVSVVFDEAGLPAGVLHDGPANLALFWNPAGLAMDEDGNVYVADAGNHAVRKISPSGDVTTLAGTGVLGHKDGAGSEAQFHYPLDVAVDDAGNVYVADTLNHAIRKITPQGDVTTLNARSGRAVEVYDGVVVPAGGYADGPLDRALFNEPSGLALDGKGNLYVSDTGNQRIRYIDFASGTVTTVAGGGELSENALYAEGLYRDGPAHEARFNSPKGIAVGPGGGLFIADSLNHAIRHLKDGFVSTVAGVGGKRGYGIGLDEEGLLDDPTDVALLPNGDLVVADTLNNSIRQIAFYELPDGWTADGTVRVLLNNRPLDFGEPPVVRSNRVMAPIRALAEAVGYTVQYARGEVVLTGGDIRVTLKTGIAEATVQRNGETTAVKLDAAPYAENGVTYAPVRFRRKWRGCA